MLPGLTQLETSQHSLQLSPDESSDEHSRTLQELRLPASLEALDKPVGLPPSLLRKAEEVRLEDGPARIDGSLENAEHLAQRCREILDQVRLDYETHIV